MREDINTIFQEHLRFLRQSRSHTALQYLLSELLRNLFAIELIDIITGLEADVRSEIIGVRGKTDLLYHNLVMEVKTDLGREIDDAEAQMEKYFQSLLERDSASRNIGVVTDCIKFIQYVPIIEEDIVTGIKEISSIDLDVNPHNHCFLWLDSILFSEQQIIPTADDLKYRYGVGSHTYSYVITELEKAWNLISDKESNNIKLELWKKHMEIVYGETPSLIGFFEQTYLIVLVKLIVYLRIFSSSNFSDLNIIDALTGKYFRSYGISNLVEEGYYSWITDELCIDILKPFFTTILKELTLYELESIDEDLFKEIYQEIVKKEDRHRVGEYYTPEWLSELTLQETYETYRTQNDAGIPSILDPACGSGTFLTNSIHLLKRELSEKEPRDLLNIILDKVVGADINPLAVYIARANYIFALGDLIASKEDIITLPVYVSDTFQLELNGYDASSGVYEINAADKHLNIPYSIIENSLKYKNTINEFEKAIFTYVDFERDREVSARRINENALELEEAELVIIKKTLSTLFDLIDEDKNSVWLFILSNTLAPIQFRLKEFDIIVGNPPWISMRYIENTSYQNYIKEKTLQYNLIDSGDVQLFANMEMATVFFNNAIENYLSEKGIIGFVMPRSIITGALHHINFKSFTNPTVRLNKILDFEKVAPIFNVPCCTIICTNTMSTEYPVPINRYIGKLVNKNSKLSDVIDDFEIIEEEYSPPFLDGLRSPYYDSLRMGARLAPRPFFFIEFVSHPTLGINPQLPMVQNTDESKRAAKGSWGKVDLSGTVEAQYIFSTLLSRDVIPFGYRKMRPVVVPASINENKFILLDNEELHNIGAIHTGAYFKRVEDYWQEYGTERSKKNFPSILDRINYQGLLTSQNPLKRYILVYVSAGKYLVSTVVDRQNIPNLQMNGIEVPPTSFIAESDTWIFESDNEDEAHYLCSMLNSDVLTEAVRPLQTRGLFGERHIHRRPFLFTIPTFDESNEKHITLAEISKQQHVVVQKLRSSITEKSITGPRLRIKRILARELRRIDEIIAILLNL